MFWLAHVDFIAEDIATIAHISLEYFTCPNTARTILQFACTVPLH